LVVADLKYPKSKELIAEYRRRYGDKTLLGFSRGKDSIAAALAIRDQLDVYPVFFYVIPGLGFIEEGLEYYSRVLFGGRRVIQFPEAAFYKWLNGGLLQTPHTHEVIKAAGFRSFGGNSGHVWWRDVTSWVI
jgi:hypothetical protein